MPRLRRARYQTPSLRKSYVRRGGLPRRALGGALGADRAVVSLPYLSGARNSTSDARANAITVCDRAAVAICCASILAPLDLDQRGVGARPSGSILIGR